MAVRCLRLRQTQTSWALLFVCICATWRLKGTTFWWGDLWDAMHVKALRKNRHSLSISLISTKAQQINYTAHIKTLIHLHRIFLLYLDTSNTYRKLSVPSVFQYSCTDCVNIRNTKYFITLKQPDFQYPNVS